MIRLCLSEENFEYDIRGLLMSFYPGETITTKIGEPDCPGAEAARETERTGRQAQVPAEADKVLRVVYRPDSLAVSFSVGEREYAEDQANDYADRKETKCALKRMLYGILSEETKKTLPWGTLTGIRPTKIPMALLEQGAAEEEIRDYMQRTYLTGDKKTALAIDIARREKEILKDIDYENGYSIYIGIPFCPTTCLYCSFTSYPIGKWAGRMEEYLEALFKEIDYTAEAFAGKKLNTVYIGGGTPTTLTADQMDRLLTKVEESFDFTYVLEFTVEAGRPDSITREKLEAIRRHKVTRISINPQTMKQETLRLIGRQHTTEQIREVYHLAREIGFDNINMDLILGLPEETKEDVQHTMEEMLALRPDNLTVHSLAIKRASRLNLQWEKYADMKMENTEELMELTASYAARMGLEPYYLYRQKNMSGNLENVGYAAPGKAGIYNILIMEEKQSIVAMGAGSTTKAVFPGGRIERADNVKDIEQYLSRIDEMIERKRRLFAGGREAVPEQARV